MDDRELLERAAEAAGFHFHGHRVGCDYTNCYVSVTGDSDDWFVWSPLTDDGDALRLAVKLRMAVKYEGNTPPELHLPRECSVAITDDGRWFAEAAADPCAATRRAIVRAAAELSRRG